MITIGLLAVVAVVIVLVFPHVAKRRVLGDRDDLADEKLVELFSSSSLPRGELLTLLKQIGACYGIAYTQLRPDDCFISRLSKIDSWHFDAGAVKLEKLLREDFGTTVPDGLKTFTILDLLKLVGTNKKTDQQKDVTSSTNKKTSRLDS